MKRFIFLAFFLLSSLGLGAQEIRSIDLRVYIDDEGDAYVVQDWDVNVVRGTEWYIPIAAWKGGSVRGLKVEENGEEFIDEGRDWDSDRTREEKAGRSGIIDKGSDGVELCWGLGTLGDHQWTAGFVVLGLVQSLKDYDAFNFMFVNPELVAAPQHVSIRFIRLDDKPFTEEETRFWVFGCEGESQLMEDGTIYFESTEPLGKYDSLIVMMRFDKEFFHPTSSRNIKFEKMQKKAFKGSSYKKDSGWDFWTIIGVIIFIGVPGLIILLVIYLILRDIVLLITGLVWKRKIFGSAKPRGWYRQPPFDGNLPLAYYLLHEGKNLVFATEHPERGIGAYFLKWISEGVVKPIKTENGKYNLAFPETAPAYKDECEKHLFSKCIEAAGSNRILEAGEFKSWAATHYTSIENWPKLVKKDGEAAYDALTEEQRKKAVNLLEFKNYLSDFTLSKEREVPEAGLWGQYLIYAQLFGIADKVQEGMSKLYPAQFAEYSRSLGVEPSDMNLMVSYWTRSTHDAYKVAHNVYTSNTSSSSSRSSSGYGGHSSRGGGGGFSGGGRGGGSR